MTTMIIGIDGIARARKRPGQPGIATTMFSQTMRDLDNGARQSPRLPTIDENLGTIRNRHGKARIVPPFPPQHCGPTALYRSSANRWHAEPIATEKPDSNR